MRYFVDRAFDVVGMKFKFEGEGVDEVGIEIVIGCIFVCVYECYFCFVEVDFFIGDLFKALNKLKWNSRTTSFEEFIKEMVEVDIVCIENLGL